MRLRRRFLGLLAGLTLLLALPLPPALGALKFMNNGAPTSVTGLHPTSGLSGFPARDYMAPGGTLVRAPFNGCVPKDRPWGWLSYQNPAAGFGGARIYLKHNKSGNTAYLSHFGDPRYGNLFKKPGECFRQGDPIGYVWYWPGTPGRSHIHMGWTGGDPLYSLVRVDGSFIIKEAARATFPRIILRYEGNKWRVYTAKGKLIYQGGEKRAKKVYNNQKLARTINLHFKNTYADSPLIGTGVRMVQIYRRYNVDPRLGAAIASCESGAGTAGEGSKVYNPFGLFDGKTGRLREFKSWEKAYNYHARLLGGPKYEGRNTIAKIGERYAPVGAKNDPHNKNRHWVPCVTKVYKKLNGTRYLPKVYTLRKVAKVAAKGNCDKAGRWQVLRDDKVVFQCQYKPALEFKKKNGRN